MKTSMTGGVVAALVGIALSFASLPASAQLARPQTAVSIAGDNDLTTEVRWRGGGGWRGGGWGWRGGGGYRPWYGAGLGFAAGYALTAPYYYGPPVYYAQPGGDAVGYCMRRFRSYDPASGTYLGFDGRRHPCP